MKQSLKSRFRKSSLYVAYRDFSKRHKWRRMNKNFWKLSDEDQKCLDFYRQFIAEGSLVIDVGANLGNRAKLFSKLGAVVVAVEPQTMCADFLQSVFKNTSNFHLVRKALGASVGQTEMLISNAHTISSLSADWVSAVTESGRFSQYEWDRKESVLVDTLDNLISQYGCPNFIKIDVEGFEDQVISGLSTPVGALSMEFTPEFMVSTLKCIDHLDSIGDFCFQISIGESMKFALPNWVKSDQIKKTLSEVSSNDFGDLYARLIEG